METKSSICFVALVLSVFTATASWAQDAAPAAAPAPFFFHDGDTPAVFLGDSITEQKLYSTLVETYALTRYPALKITFRNAGWGSDTSWLIKRGEFDASLQRDVLALKPKVVTIDYGMFDARGGDGTYSKYLEYTTRLIKDIEKSGARVALITPTPEERYEADAPAGSAYNVMLKKYVDGLKIVSDNEKVPLIDIYTPFIGLIDAGRKAGVLSTAAAPGDPNVVRLTNEGIHPNWGGHFIMATLILQAMHATPNVSSVTLDAEGHSIIASQGCSVDWQNLPNGGVQFKRKDDAIPWPIPADPKIDMVMKIPGFDPAASLNHYELKVINLKEVAYTLFIDDAMLGNYTSVDLANGVNLGFVTKGPIYDQGQDLLKAVVAKNDAYFSRWRNVQLYELPDWLAKDDSTKTTRDKELARLDGEIAKFEAEIEVLRQPVPHVFRLIPVVK